jgi:hypothetical protein
MQIFQAGEAACNHALQMRSLLKASESADARTSALRRAEDAKAFADTCIKKEVEETQ